MSDQWSDIKELFSNLVPPALHVIGNAALTAVLYGLEYLVEKNSPCPCDPEWNATHSNLAFYVPSVILFLISMMVVPGSRRMFKCGTCSRCPECGRCSGCFQCGTCSGRPESGTCSGCFQCGKCSRCSEYGTRSECPSCGSSCQNCCRNCYIVLNTVVKILIPSVIWVVILLLDGDYYACYFAPSVNQTHGHQKCKEFCSLESSSSLREHCFRSRITGSIILVLSVVLMVILKFFPRWSSCDCTKEGYYEFKYEQVLEKKKWNKMKEELGKTAEQTADMEAKKLIQKLKLGQSDQGEQSSSQGEQSSNQGEQSSNQGEQSSNHGEQSSNQGEQSSDQGEQSSNQGASTKQGIQMLMKLTPVKVQHKQL